MLFDGIVIPVGGGGGLCFFYGIVIPMAGPVRCDGIVIPMARPLVV